MSTDSSQDKTTDTTKTDSSETAAAAETTETMIYTGPTVPKEGLKRFCIYKGGLPQIYNDLFTACPEVKSLFVEVEKLSDTLNQIEKTGTAYHTWYAKVQNYIKGA